MSMRGTPSPISAQHVRREYGHQSPDSLGLTPTRSISPAAEEKVFQAHRMKESQKVLMIRVMYTFKCVRKVDRSSLLCKKFTVWKFRCQRMKAAQHAQGVDDEDDPEHNACTDEYLQALHENERLRARLDTHDEEERGKRFAVTHSGCARMLLTFWRCRILRVVAVAFHRWCLKVEHAANLLKSTELRDTLLSDQTTLGERKSKIKYADELNSRLQLSLLVVLSVLRLRAHSFLVSLSSARKRDAKVRTNLHRELVAMKKALHRFKSDDERATKTAIDRGKSYMDALQVTRDNISGALQTQKALKQENEEMNQKQKEAYTKQERFAEQVLSRSAHLIRDTSSSSSRRWAVESSDGASVDSQTHSPHVSKEQDSIADLFDVGNIDPKSATTGGSRSRSHSTHSAHHHSHHGHHRHPHNSGGSNEGDEEA